MKTQSKLFLLGTVITFLFFSCSDSSPEPESPVGPDFAISEMAGSWEAVEAVFEPSAPHQHEDQVWIIQDGGAVSMVVQSNGKFTLTIDAVDRDVYTITGKMFFEDGEFFSIAFDKYPGDYDYYSVTLTDTTLILSGAAGAAEYDFDNNGTFEPGSVFLSFVRS